MANRFKNVLSAGLLGLAMLAAGPASADYREHHGHGYSHDRGRGNGWTWGVGGLVAGALLADTFNHRAVAYDYQPPPAYVVSQPVVYSAPAPVYVPPQPAANWYYCQRPQGYYPYVQQCYSGWVAVPPRY